MFGSIYNTRREKLNRVIIIQREKSNFPRKGFLWGFLTIYFQRNIKFISLVLKGEKHA